MHLQKYYFTNETEIETIEIIFGVLLKHCAYGWHYNQLGRRREATYKLLHYLNVQTQDRIAE